MARKMKVYSWTIAVTSDIGVALGMASHHRQGRAFVAAPSMAAVKRAMEDAAGGLFNLGETGNAENRLLALAFPGVIFVRPLDGRADSQVIRLADFDTRAGRAE